MYIFFYLFMKINILMWRKYALRVRFVRICIFWENFQRFEFFIDILDTSLPIFRNIHFEILKKSRNTKKKNPNKSSRQSWQSQISGNLHHNSASTTSRRLWDIHVPCFLCPSFKQSTSGPISKGYSTEVCHHAMVPWQTGLETRNHKRSQKEMFCRS